MKIAAGCAPPWKGRGPAGRAWFARRARVQRLPFAALLVARLLLPVFVDGGGPEHDGERAKALIDDLCAIEG